MERRVEPRRKKHQQTVDKKLRELAIAISAAVDRLEKSKKDGWKTSVWNGEFELRRAQKSFRLARTAVAKHWFSIRNSYEDYLPRRGRAKGTLSVVA